MINVMCIIVGTITVMLSLMFCYEYSGGDEWLYLFILSYTCGLCTAVYGVNNICERRKK